MKKFLCLVLCVVLVLPQLAVSAGAYWATPDGSKVDHNEVESYEIYETRPLELGRDSYERYAYVDNTQIVYDLYSEDKAILSVKINYKDGSEQIIERSEFGNLIEKILSDQSYKDPWKVDNSYEVSVYINGNELKMKVDIIDTVIFSYSVVDGEAYIEGWRNRQDSKFHLADVVIPEKINGYTVVGINSLDFRYENIDTITVPDTVKYIAPYAFRYCPYVTEINIGSGVGHLAPETFVGMRYHLKNINVSKDNPYYCSVDGVVFSKDKTTLVAYPGGKGSEYVLPETVTDFKNTAYYPNVNFSTDRLAIETVTENGVVFSSDKSVIYKADGTISGDYTVPATVKEIYPGAFRNCTSLNSVSIPASVTEIAYVAFEGCTSLTSVSVPDTLCSINDYAFSNCVSLESFDFDCGVETLGEFSFAFTGLKSLVLPDTVAEMGKGCFYHSALENVEINGSLSAIPDSAFYSNTKLKNAVLGEGIEIIGNKAFDQCIALEEINIPDSVTEIGSNTFTYSSLAYIPLGKGQTEIPDSYMTGCKNLREVILPDGIVYIGESAFSNCGKIETVNIPDSVTDMGKSAFKECISISDVHIGAGLTYIPDSAFESCKSIKSIDIPLNINSIGYWGFRRCHALANINIPHNYIEIGCDAFIETAWFNAHPNGAVYIGNSLYKYKGHINYDGNPLRKTVYIKDGTTSISAGAFDPATNAMTDRYGRNGFAGVYIPEEVVFIGTDAFKNCGIVDIYYEGSEEMLFNNISGVGKYSFDGHIIKFNYEIPDGKVASLTIDGYEQWIEVGQTWDLKVPSAEYDFLSGKAYAFKKWTCEGITLYDPTATYISFAMPNNSVSLTKETYIHGNVNEDEGGKVTAADMLALLDGIKNSAESEAYDVNLDGKITAADKLALMQVIKGTFDYSQF